MTYEYRNGTVYMAGKPVTAAELKAQLKAKKEADRDA